VSEARGERLLEGVGLLARVCPAGRVKEGEEGVELLALVLACQFLGLLVAEAEVQLVLVLVCQFLGLLVVGAEVQLALALDHQ
jgi:hypothetical protein